MFGIWVFTSQGAPGSLVLKCLLHAAGRDPVGPARTGLEATSCPSGSALSQLTCPEAPHLLSLARVSVYATFCPWALQAGCTPGSALPTVLPQLRRQAGTLAFAETFLCPALGWDLVLITNPCSGAWSLLRQVRKGGSERPSDLPRSTQPVHSRAAGGPGLLDPEARAASPTP